MFQAPGVGHVPHGRQPRRGPSMIPTSCLCAILSLSVWIELTDLLLMNGIWQKPWDDTKFRLQEDRGFCLRCRVLRSLFRVLLTLGKNAAILCATLWRDPRGKEPMTLINSQ